MEKNLPASVNPPKGWTVNPTYAEFKERWAGSSSEGQKAALRHGLGPATPIMEDDPARRTIFRSGDKFYLWDRELNSLHEFATENVHEIVSTMVKHGGLEGLDMKAVAPVLDVGH